MSAISQAEGFAGKSGSLKPELIDSMVESAVKLFDPEHGGFGSAPKFPHPSGMDLLMQRCAETGSAELLNVITTSLDKMARGGVYDQLAGGFHRYSVDEHWIVPHFEKMSYDNSELLKNYVHGYQLTGNEFFAFVAKDIVRWMDEVLSDREHGGFYASQDADISLDDDGDYFTWTLDEAEAVLSTDELQVAMLHYDIGEVGEMHHNPAKNVLYLRASIEEVAERVKKTPQEVQTILDSAKKKMYAARLQRTTPFVDKTVYVGWNALCISAYLKAARVLKLDDARRFALRSLDRILSQGWDAKLGLQRVLAYSDPQAAKRRVPGVLEDYAFTAIACLDAYEASADLSYFHFAEKIAEQPWSRASMIRVKAASLIWPAGLTWAMDWCWARLRRGANLCRIHPRRRAIPWRRLLCCGCTLTPMMRAPRSGGRNVKSLCRNRRALRAVCFHVRDCAGYVSASAYAGGGGRQRSKSRATGSCGVQKVLFKPIRPSSAGR